MTSKHWNETDKHGSLSLVKLLNLVVTLGIAFNDASVCNNFFLCDNLQLLTTDHVNKIALLLQYV